MRGLSLPKEPRLKELVLWVTTDCNLCYRYCYASGGDEAEYMGGQVAKQALDLMLSQSDGFKIQFAGGEPLLNMNPIEQVVRYTQGRSIRYQLQTNATLINKGMSFEPARDLWAGVSDAIYSKNWKDEKDLGEIYVVWGGYAYGGKNYGVTVPERFKKRLSQLDLTVKNEDTCEYDMLDSDDFYSYHGG